MGFWAYMIQCADRHFYTGHTNDLETRLGQHQAGTMAGYSSTRRPVHLVWAQEFGTRDEALEAERRIKGWGRAKKLALIRGDWGEILRLARGWKGEGRASTSSAQTLRGGTVEGHFLHPHLSLPPSVPFGIEAKVRRRGSGFRVRFELRGPIERIVLPPAAEAVRRDGLWRSTCFEVFVTGDGGYLEYNLAPSSEWAAYRFSGYREGMAVLEVPAPGIWRQVETHLFTLEADVALPADFEAVALGLSAVIEEIGGATSYWALRHPPGEAPDFHHPDCFALALSPPAEP